MKTKLDYDIFNDYNELVHIHLQNFGFTVLPSELRDSLRIYFNYTNRIVDEKNWIIKKSNNLIIPANLQDGFNLLESYLTEGKDIKPFMSRKLKDPLFFDALLNDWGIHHLHLGNIFANDGFVKRNKEVLFVKFWQDTAYMIAIGDHNAWSRKELLEELGKNWPDLLGLFELKGVIDISHNPSNEEINDLRKAGLNSAVEINGKFYSSIGGGYSISGESMHSLIATNQTMKKIKNLEKFLKKNESKIIKKCKERISPLPPVLRGRLIVLENRDCFFQVETLKINFKIGSI